MLLSLLPRRRLRRVSRLPWQRRSEWHARPQRLPSGEALIPVLRRRLALSALLSAALAALVGFFLSFYLNAINGALGSLLVVALAGCLFESLLAVYDVRGRLRQFVFFATFMFL